MPTNRRTPAPAPAPTLEFIDVEHHLARTPDGRFVEVVDDHVEEVALDRFSDVFTHHVPTSWELEMSRARLATIFAELGPDRPWRWTVLGDRAYDLEELEHDFPAVVAAELDDGGSCGPMGWGPFTEEIGEIDGTWLVRSGRHADDGDADWYVGGEGDAGFAACLARCSWVRIDDHDGTLVSYASRLRAWHMPWRRGRWRASDAQRWIAIDTQMQVRVHGEWVRLRSLIRAVPHDAPVEVRLRRSDGWIAYEQRPARSRRNVDPDGLLPIAHADLHVVPIVVTHDVAAPTWATAQLAGDLLDAIWERDLNDTDEDLFADDIQILLQLGPQLEGLDDPWCDDGLDHEPERTAPAVILDASGRRFVGIAFRDAQRADRFAVELGITTRVVVRNDAIVVTHHGTTTASRVAASRVEAPIEAPWFDGWIVDSIEPGSAFGDGAEALEVAPGE